MEQLSKFQALGNQAQGVRLAGAQHQLTISLLHCPTLESGTSGLEDTGTSAGLREGNLNISRTRAPRPALHWLCWVPHAAFVFCCFVIPLLRLLLCFLLLHSCLPFQLYWLSCVFSFQFVSMLSDLASLGSSPRTVFSGAKF